MTTAELEAVVRDLRAANAALVDALVIQARASAQAAASHQAVVEQLATVYGRYDDALTTLMPLEPL